MSDNQIDITTGYLSFEKGSDGIPFQTIPGTNLWNFWHPGENPNKKREITAILAAEMRRRVELGHGTWKQLAVLYGFPENLDENLYPYCKADIRFRLVCQELATDLAKSIIYNDEQAKNDIMDVIEERVWYLDWEKQL